MKTLILAVLVAYGVQGAIAPARPTTPASVANPSGLSVVLLLDVSASNTRGPLAIDQRLARVLDAFLQGLTPADRGALGVVARRIRMSPLIANPREIAMTARTLLQMTDADRLGPSPLWDAVDQAVTLAASGTGRGAVVMYTDAKSSGNLRGLDEVIEHAKRAGVAVHVVVEGDSLFFIGPGTERLDPADLIDTLAQGTGGLRLLDRPPNPRDRNPARFITQIMETLHRVTPPAPLAPGDVR